MGKLTLSDISGDIILVVGLITGATFLLQKVKDAIVAVLKEHLKTINDKLDVLSDRVNKVDAQQTKNYLVRCIKDIERGEQLDDAEMIRFWEQYGHYTDGLKENGYIKKKVEKLQKENKI